MSEISNFIQTPPVRAPGEAHTVEATKGGGRGEGRKRSLPELRNNEMIQRVGIAESLRFERVGSVESVRFGSVESVGAVSFDI